jgi:hypothetical protein
MDAVPTIETARIVRQIKSYDDGSGHHYTVTVIRMLNKDTRLAAVEIQIEEGSDLVTISASDWDDVRRAVESAVAFASECTE